MIQGVCPICGKRFEIASIADHPGFPFCSNRCKLVDLGRGIGGRYGVPGVEARPETDPAASSEEENEE